MKETPFVKKGAQKLGFEISLQPIENPGVS